MTVVSIIIRALNFSIIFSRRWKRQRNDDKPARAVCQEGGRKKEGEERAATYGAATSDVTDS